MKTICLYFEIHQNIQLKRYRFFDIGTDHYYYDDYEDERLITDVANRSYMPALEALGEMLKEHPGFFKVAFSLSGVGMEQLELHAPQVLEKLQELNNTGCVEFLAEPSRYGSSSLVNTECFINETKRQMRKMKELFGHTPKVLRNSSLIYNDEIGAIVANMGFKGMMVEGAKHIMGWRSPHYVYSCAQDSRLSLLMRDYKLSDDISLRFSDSSWSEYPLMADKYVGWISSLPEGEDVINIMMELSAFGIYQPLSSNILEFFRAIPDMAAKLGVKFATPSEVISKNKPVGPLEVIYPVSWNDEERDTSSMLGNGMQREAFAKLYDEKVVGRILACRNRRIQQDWDRLQSTENFRFMTTKNNGMSVYRGIYDNEYDAFTNYMNILGDFLKRVHDLYSDDVENDELNSLYTQIANMAKELTVKDNEISRLRARLEKYEPKVETPAIDVGNSEPAPQAAKASAPEEVKTETKPVAKAVKKSAPKAEKKSAAKTEKKPAVKAEKKPAPKAEKKPAAKTAKSKPAK